MPGDIIGAHVTRRKVLLWLQEHSLVAHAECAKLKQILCHHGIRHNDSLVLAPLPAQPGCPRATLGLQGSLSLGIAQLEGALQDKETYEMEIRPKVTYG